MDATCTADSAEQTFCRSFRGDRAELAAVRRFAGDVLPADCPVLADFVLMLDEVAANAVLHTDSGLPGGAFHVVIRHCWDTARCEVFDAGARSDPGTPRPPEWSKEAGRGLLIVSMLAKEWGSERLSGGRIVWFEAGDPDCPAAHDRPPQDHLR